MENCLENFVYKARKEDQFVLNDYSYVKMEAKDGFAIYGAAVSKKNPIISMDGRLEVVAIIDSEGCIHVIEEYPLGCWNKKTSDFPKKTFRYYETVTQINEKANKLLEELMDNSSCCECVLSKNQEKQADMIAWEWILTSKTEFNISEITISKESCYYILLGALSLDDIVTDYFNNNRTYLSERKAIYEKAKSIYRNHSGNDEEIKIYHILDGIEAKTIRVLFNVNGNEAEGKIDPSLILSAIKRRSEIKGWNFITWKIGEEVFDTIFGKMAGHWDDKLYPKNIKDIRYGRKVLYQR